jgi:hypothetical protein
LEIQIMQFVSNTVLRCLGFTCIVASMAACGGTKHEAKAPALTAATMPRGGSDGADPSAMTGKSPVKAPPANATASASTKDDGSDIIPPFPSAKGPSKAEKSRGKALKKK